MTNFGTLEKLNLKEISEAVRVVERTQRALAFDPARILFNKMPDLEFKPEKPYTARTEIPLTFQEKSIGNVVVVLFRPGDGTGSVTPEGITPRDKSGTLVEAYMPLGSLDLHAQRFIHGANCLELLTTKEIDGKPSLAEGAHLGYNPLIYRQCMTVWTGGGSTGVELTTGFTRSGTRFGDPHAILYKPVQGLPETIQVVGFVAATSPNSPLCSILDQYRPAQAE
jgi:hypothetical protein